MQEVADQLRRNCLFQTDVSIHLVLALTKTLAARDISTFLHSQNVAHYAILIAEEMGFSKQLGDSLYLGGLLHDIGKIGTPEAILLKPATLTKEEYEVIKAHTKIGFETLNHIDLFKESGILDMILHHHERFDGKGYPNGLQADEIPLHVRILTVADSFEAMTAKRVYKPGRCLEFAYHEIQEKKGLQFDPDVADAFLTRMKA